MNLTPTEIDRLIIFAAAEFARRNRALGIKLSHPEAVALLTDEAMTMARQGLPYGVIRDRASAILSDDDVQSGVRSMISKILVELPMLEGTKLLVLFDPIRPTGEESVRPGEVIPAEPVVDVLADVETIELDVVNLGDRDIQVRSQTHFFEVNRALAFDREQAYGKRLAIVAGSGVRFEPGVPQRVRLTEISGTRDIRGSANLVNGPADHEQTTLEAIRRAVDRGYLDPERKNDFD